LLAVNARSVFLGSRAAIPILRAQGGGVILNTCSTAGIRPRPGLSAYAASKAAAEAWTLALADAFRKEGGDEGPNAAAAILIVKALVNDQMRAERPNAKFAGFTDVTELAEAIAGVWGRPAPEVNGQRLWLTPKP
jgi:NAD(P)-dependent dehydrogenase (short-subunit alcohol dehydrogenase family)